MNRTLKKWIIDTVAADMRSSYRRVQALPFEYEFIGRYADFYVNMLTRMFNILDEEYTEMYDEERQKQELLNIAHGMEIFNERWKLSDFTGVNRNDNALYVATIYYLCDYEAVATMYLNECCLTELRTDAARIIFYIISGGGFRSNEIEDHGIKHWLTTGDASVLSDFQTYLEGRAEKMSYNNADDFFDSQLLRHILKKFQNNNIRKDLYHLDSSVSWDKYILYSLKNIYSLSCRPNEKHYIRDCLISTVHSR